MRRRKLLLATVAAVVALAMVAGAGAFAHRPGPDRITKEGIDRIWPNMSRAEVEAIFGPPGDYRTGPVECDARLVPLQFFPGVPNPSDDALCWAGDSAYITVLFDPTGRVRHWVFVPTERVNRSPSGDLLWRLKSQWRRWLWVYCHF
jgi:hypothetical protein